MGSLNEADIRFS